MDEPRNLVAAIDIGGTFTDIVLLDGVTRQLFIGKYLTSADDPSRAVMAGLSDLLHRNALPATAVEHMMHATTLVTNAIVERKGAKVGLLTTRGFRDVLEIAREVKYEIYDLSLSTPAPLVPRERRREVCERVGAGGEIAQPLDVAQADAAVDSLVALGCEAIAAVFLHSYRNPVHEQAVGERLRQRHPDVFATLSCEVAPEIREYERASTTVANAYVQPLIDRYLARLMSGLQDRGFGGSFHMMLSSGGLTSIEEVRSHPVEILESGPAAGALVAGTYARLTGYGRIVAFDMGGTTAKTCIVEDGAPRITYGFEAAREERFKRGSGLPIRTTSVDLIEVGAGGGSLARIGDLGLLKVGPESAGCMPGPVCYGHGGTMPTVTDANLILGYYGPSSFLGGEMALDVAAAEAALKELAARLGLSLEEAAWGIFEIVNEQMCSAMRIHLAENGRDPTNFTLLATGGGGPCHGPRVAQKLGMSGVLCPPNAGVASALGLIAAPPRVDFARSGPMLLEQLDVDLANAWLKTMRTDARRILAEIGVAADRVELSHAADVRYVGQGFEVAVALPAFPLDGAAGSKLAEAFEKAYEERYGRRVFRTQAEVLTWRTTAAGPRPSNTFMERRAPPAAGMAGSIKGERRAYFPETGGYQSVPVYDRYALADGDSGDGPAILEERESTLVVPPRARWLVDRLGFVRISLEGER